MVLGKLKWCVKWNLDYKMKLIDLYIIKRYIGTFTVMILLFIPIGIMVDVAEKIDKFKEKEVPFVAIIGKSSSLCASIPFF